MKRLGWVEIECPKCGRQGRLSLARLISERGGEARLTELLDEVSAGCPHRQATSVYDRCAARYVGL